MKYQGKLKFRMKISDFVQNLINENSWDESDVYSPPASTVFDSSSDDDSDLANLNVNDLELDEDLDDSPELEGNGTVGPDIDSESESHSLPASNLELEKQDGHVEVAQVKKTKVVCIQVSLSGCGILLTGIMTHWHTLRRQARPRKRSRKEI